MLHGKQLLNVLMRRDMNHGIVEAEIQDGIKRGEALVTKYRAAAASKALTSTGVGTGDELVPSDLSSELQRRLYLLTGCGSSSGDPKPANPLIEETGPPPVVDPIRKPHYEIENLSEGGDPTMGRVIELSPDLPLREWPEGGAK